jgi:hypothetical protein
MPRLFQNPGGEERRILALLSEVPAGRVSTRSAGAVSFQATLYWLPEDGIPAGSILGDLAPGARFWHLVQTDDAVSATRRISCEIRALHSERLTASLDETLRSVAAHAALTEAVLETRAVRLTDPSVAPAAVVETLARQLWDAKLPVSFGPSWTPAPGADVSVGVRGLEEAFESFLGGPHGWRTPSPIPASSPSKSPTTKLD